MTCFLLTSINTAAPDFRLQQRGNHSIIYHECTISSSCSTVHTHIVGCVVALPWNPSARISPRSCRYSGTEGCEFTSLIGSFRCGNGVGAYSSPLKSRQPSPLHTLPHHSCSTTPPRSCLAMHARTDAWALIVEPSHKSHRYPCLEGLSVSFSYRFVSARDLREPWPWS
jgi:hypothetical protein